MTYTEVFAGYEAKRETLYDWGRRHYLAEFGLQPGRLLDAGCGNGFWAEMFRREGFEVIGVDIRPDLIADGRLKYPALTLVMGDIEHPQEQARGFFDVVFARTLPQFYGPDLARMEAVVANLLRHRHPGGTLLLSIYSDGSGEDRPMLVDGVARHHPTVAYLDTVEAAGGTVTKAARVGNYLQLAVR